MRKLTGIRNKDRNFHDHVKRDISRVIFNSNEFCQTALINGKQIKGDLIRDVTGHSRIGQEMQARNANMARETWTFYCPKDDIGNDYRSIAKIRIDHAEYTVLQISDEMGILAFSLSRVQQRGTRI